MRIIITIMIWVILIGGLWLYIGSRSENLQVITAQKETVVTGYRLEITTSFTAEVDPFYLWEDNEKKSSSLSVKLNGREIFRKENSFQRGATLKIDPLEGFIYGKNEFYIVATPHQEAEGKNNALRLKLYHGDELINDKTLWSGDISGRIASVVEVHIEKPDVER